MQQEPVERLQPVAASVVDTAMELVEDSTVSVEEVWEVSRLSLGRRRNLVSQSLKRAPQYFQVS